MTAVPLEPDEPSVVLHLVVDETAWVLDEVHVEPIDGDRYRVLRTPLLIVGMAAGDTIQVTEAAKGRFDVLERGGNVGVQVFLPRDDPGPAGAIDTELTPSVVDLGGRLDDHVPGRAVAYSIPVRAGFAAIETVMNGFVSRYPGAEWSYANVYADDGVTPLNWWTS